jgi:hypothetical protein
MKVFLPILAVLCLLSSLACVTSSVTSTKSENMHGPYKRIFVVISNSERAEKFISGFIESVKKEMQVRKTESAFFVSGRISKDTRNEINKKISDFQPEAVLVINQTTGLIYNGSNLGSGTGFNGGDFDLRLFVNGEDNLVWRGKLSAFGEYGISTAVRKASYSLISKFVIDGIISE